MQLAALYASFTTQLVLQLELCFEIGVPDVFGLVLRQSYRKAKNVLEKNDNREQAGYDIELYRCRWQRSETDIYPAKEIISKCYYNRNETETVVTDQLKQASNTYYPSQIYINDEDFCVPI